ncbi:MAG: hypothetical protein MUE36_13080 [Acidimicrobiales bacterium]|jgi:alkylhydroperoxidase family enzyme|nr:hypothetical protein [Acidimicrobiales bacterium]
MGTATDGRKALDTWAAAAGAALVTVEETVWATAVGLDDVDTVDLLARVTAAAHGLAPLGRPEALGPGPWVGRDPTRWRDFVDLDERARTAAAFAEHFAVDVATIDDEERAGLGGALGAATGDIVQAVWALDMIPRVRAALDTLFGSSGWPPPAVGSPDPGLWASIDAYIHVVPGLEHLDPVLTELVRLRGANAHRCRLCQSLRSRPALLAGADDATFAAVERYESSDLPPATKAALGLTDAMVWLPGRIDPGVTEAVRAHLDGPSTVELVLDVARNATNKIAVAFAADTPHVTDGYEIYEITPDGEAHYGLTLD